MQSKIQNLIISWPKHTVALTSFLNEEFEVSNALIAQYKKSNWIASIGQGAFVKIGDTVHYKGGIYALQKQANLSIHPGGLTALSLQSLTHFIEVSQKKAVLYQYTNEVLPKWFKNHRWEVKLVVHQTAFLPKDMGLTSYKLGEYSILISNRIRALMEVLLVAKDNNDYIEAYEIMEKFNDLDPKQVQQLLEHSTSIKVNRSFLYMASKSKHRWYNKIDKTKIDLGKGQRSLVKNGIYNQEFKIMVPKEIEAQNEREFL